MGRRRKEQLYSLLDKFGVTGIEDDTNHDLIFNAREASCLSALGTSADIIYCSSFSKTLASSLRIGWLIPGQWKEKITELKYEINLGTNELAQHIVAQFLKSGEYCRHVRKMRVIHRDTIMQIKKCIDQYWGDNVKHNMPTGGFLLWVKMPSGISTARFCELARQKNICIAEGYMFGKNVVYAKNIRIGWSGRWAKRIQKAMRLLGELLHTLKS